MNLAIGVLSRFAAFPESLSSRQTFNAGQSVSCSINQASPAFYGNRGFVFMFTETRYWYCPELD
jgi:hypothetical protein